MTDSKELQGLRIKFKSPDLNSLVGRYRVDFSRGGIFIRSNDPLPQWTDVRFCFQLSDGSVVLEGRGMVVWVRRRDPDQPHIVPGYGLRFDELTDDSKVNFAWILDQKEKAERGAAAASPPN